MKTSGSTFDRKPKIERRRVAPHRPSCRECPFRGPRGECLDRVPLKSGRCGDWVWYVWHGQQFRRRWVLPKDRRTVKQQRWRARLGAASRKYSSGLTEVQREECRAAARKRRSRKRLGQSGPLTGQQYSVGKACRAWAKAERRKSIINKAKALHSQALKDLATAQVPRRQRLARGTWESRRTTSRPTPEQHRANQRPAPRPRAARRPRPPKHQNK